jgi:hypothetical protein
MAAYAKSPRHIDPSLPPTAAEAGQKPRRRLVVKALKIAIAVALLAVLVLHIGWRDLANSFASLAWWWIPALLAVRLCGLFLQSLRWKLFLDTHAIHASPLRLFRQYWVSRFFNNFLPGQAGGDASRIFYGWDKTVKKTKLTSSVIMDRVVGLLGLFLVAAAVGFARYDFVSRVGLGLWPWCAAAGAIVVLALITMRAPTIWAQRVTRFLPSKALRSNVAGVLRDLAVHNGQWGQLAAGVALSAGFYVVAALHAYLAFLAFGVEIDFVGILVTVPLIAMIMAVPISVNGWGVAEVVKVVLYAQLGATSVEALSVALLGRVTLSLIGGIGGVIYLLSPDRAAEPRRGRSWPFFQTGA